jgi:hypothetical protein
MGYERFSRAGNFTRPSPREKPGSGARAGLADARLAGASNELEMGVLRDELTFSEIVASRSAIDKKMFAFFEPH